MPPRSAAVVLAGLLAAAGCGKKAPPPAADADPPDEPAVAAVTPPPTTATPPPTAATPKPARPAPEKAKARPRETEPAVHEAPPPRRAGTPAPAGPPGGPVVFQPPPAITPPPGPVPPAPPPPAPPPGPGTPPEAKPKEPQWLTEVNGKNLDDVLKALSDPDPMVRESALRTLPYFGPPALKRQDKTGRSVVAQKVLHLMEKEGDPAVRFAAYAVAANYGFELKDYDIKEAVRILRVAADRGAAGGPTRLHAVQALAVFGYKAEGAVDSLVGPPHFDLSYETRRSVAAALGRIGVHEYTGPSHAALKCLTEKMITDPCVAVRLEAMQSVVLLGPPLVHRDKDKAAVPLRDIKDPGEFPRVDEKAAAGYVLAIKKRIGAAKGARDQEPDDQVDVWARLALIRLDPKELNDENLNAFARHLTAKGKDAAAKLQALQAFALLGEAGLKKVTDVAGALADDDPTVVTAAATALASMGPKAAAVAVPALEKVRGRGTTKEEKEGYTRLADEAIKAINMTRPKK